MEINKFNIRVYGILISKENKVLVCDEVIKGMKITKFPGGGLEFGEGTVDCLKREFMEEAALEIEVGEHFYTTDYFQVSAYNPSHQIISIYYRVNPIAEFTELPFDLSATDDSIEFRWIDIKVISENDFTLPIDKIVGKMLHKYYE